MRVLLYLVIISFGAFIGYKEVVSKKMMDNLGLIQYFCLLFLLFIMGVKIGINEEIIYSFPKLGLSALIISIFSILFSVLGVRFISRFINSVKKVEKI